MSNSVLPSFPGLTWDISRRPLFSTIVKNSVSGREYTYQNYQYPLWQYRLKYEVLRARTALPEMQQLVAFFNSHGGRFDSWLYTDPDDSAISTQSIGVGNGSNTDFQLVRSFGGFTEPVYEPNVITNVQVNGVGAAYTHLGNGVVRMTAAPANGATVRWTGTFYWRCRFLQDQLDLVQFMKQFWELRTLEFKTVKP